MYFCIRFTDVSLKSFLSDYNRTRNHNHLVCKQTLNHLVKLATLTKCFSVHLQTKWQWVRVPLQTFKLQMLHLFLARSSLSFRQIQFIDSP